MRLCLSELEHELHQRDDFHVKAVVLQKRLESVSLLFIHTYKKLALISFRKIRVGHIAISSYLPVDRTQHGLDVVHLILHLCMLRVELAETPRHRLLKLPDPLLENFRISPS